MSQDEYVYEGDRDWAKKPAYPDPEPSCKCGGKCGKECARETEE